MDCSTPGFPAHHQLPELTQTHVHWVNDAIQLSHPLLSPLSSRLQSFPASGSPGAKENADKRSRTQEEHIWPNQTSGKKILWDIDFLVPFLAKTRRVLGKRAWLVILKKTAVPDWWWCLKCLQEGPHRAGTQISDWEEPASRHWYLCAGKQTRFQECRKRLETGTNCCSSRFKPPSSISTDTSQQAAEAKGRSRNTARFTSRAQTAGLKWGATAW